MGDSRNEKLRLAETGIEELRCCKQSARILKQHNGSRARVVINADDLGLSKSVNESVFRLARLGAITSVSLLAVGSNVEAALEWAGTQDNVSIGVHLCLTDGFKPITQASGIVNKEGKFPSLTGFAGKAICGLVSEETIYEEWRAQIELIRSRGIKVSHLDSHQHVHMLPSIAPVIIRLAKEEHLAVRHTSGPFGFSLTACKPCHAFLSTMFCLGIWKSLLLRWYGKKFKAQLNAAGISTVDIYISPSSLCSRMRRVASPEAADMLAKLAALSSGTVEWVVHPSDTNVCSQDPAWMQAMRSGDLLMLEGGACAAALGNVGAELSTWQL